MEENKTFTINAKTCTLKYNKQEGKATILENEYKYIIPIYQRPYSWSDAQLSKFINDIFFSYWGIDAIANEEPMFIGTMQLSSRTKDNTQEIIDGQQRLTTFFIFFKVLKSRFPDCKELQKIELNWLRTKVDNGNQQEYLNKVIENDFVLKSETQNPYLKNAYYIIELLDEQIKFEDDKSDSFDIDRFTNHLLSNIYFVVIETRAGLSKTLQIFNAINTTGLDLNGGDIFKLRMYEYLTDKKGKSEDYFNQISDLYKKIDDKNIEFKDHVTDIRGILSIYQYLLIAKYSLPVTLYSLGVDTFFERLFDTIFNINQWEHFRNNISKLELSLEEINRLIDVRYEWENDWYQTAEDKCCYRLIEHSRYGRYADLLPVILMYVGNGQFRFDLIKLLARVYFIYSIRFQRSIYDIHNWTQDIIKALLHGKEYDVIKTEIQTKIGGIETNNNGYYNLNWFISENLTENAVRKNLICRLSAMLEEDYKSIKKEQIDFIESKLFKTAIDIEHIQSLNDIDEEKRNEVEEKWGDTINSIGNLVILEQDINRSISNNAYDVKIEGYKKSKFAIIEKHLRCHSDWNLEKCLERKDKEMTKLLNYLFNNEL